MENYIDGNSRNVGIGLIHGTELTMPFAINDSSKELLIEVIPVGSPLSPLVPSGISIDGNGRQIAGAVTDDASETITPITVDEIVGFPCVRVEFI